MGVFHVFKNCTNGNKLRNAPHITSIVRRNSCYSATVSIATNRKVKGAEEGWTEANSNEHEARNGADRSQAPIVKTFRGSGKNLFVNHGWRGKYLSLFRLLFWILIKWIFIQIYFASLQFKADLNAISIFY